MSHWWAFEKDKKVELQMAYVEYMQTLQAYIDGSLRGRMKTRDPPDGKRKKKVKIREPEPTGPVQPVIFTRADRSEVTVTFPEKWTKGDPKESLSGTRIKEE